MGRASDTRGRMVRSTALLLREEGLRGTSFPKVLAHADAPRGSLQHHFPGGRQEMLVDAVQWAGASIATTMDRALVEGVTPRGLVDRFIAHFREAFVSTNGRAACPIGAVAQEGYGDEQLRAAVADVLARWRTTLATSIEQSGVAPERAAALTDLSLAAIEGALLIARVDQSADALDRVGGLLRELLPD